MKQTPHTRQPRNGRHARGVTLVESAITMSVLVIVVGLVAPSFGQAREHRHLEGAAAQLETDIQFARSLAVALNEPVRMTFETGSGAGCYVVHTGKANACTCAVDGSAACTGTAESHKAVRFDAATPLQLQSGSHSIVFDPTKGTVTPTATVPLQGRSGAAIHHLVNIMGRVRSCSPAPTLPGFRRC